MLQVLRRGPHRSWHKLPWPAMLAFTSLAAAVAHNVYHIVRCSCQWFPVHSSMQSHGSPACSHIRSLCYLCVEQHQHILAAYTALACQPRLKQDP